MDYTAAETIAYRMTKTNPWYKLGESSYECRFCFTWKRAGYVGQHDPECLWLNARQYIELRNAPVASQGPADSPIESRVDELLAESETGDSREIRESSTIPGIKNRYGQKA